MAIANELSSDVATAVLARCSAQIEKEDLLEIVRDFYSALRPLIIEERRTRRLPFASSAEPPLANTKTNASGS